MLSSSCSSSLSIVTPSLLELGTILYIAPWPIETTYRYPSGPTSRSVIPPKPLPNIIPPSPPPAASS